MAQKEIALLKEQLAKLDDKKFDLEAWKNHTLIFLERIFGNDNSKIKLIRELHYDYSSWNLRDTAAVSKAKGEDPVKMQASEILSATITELEKLGLPANKQNNEKIKLLLQDELTGKQLKEMETVLSSDDSGKAEKISSILLNIAHENLALVIAKSLID